MASAQHQETHFPVPTPHGSQLVVRQVPRSAGRCFHLQGNHIYKCRARCLPTTGKQILIQREIYEPLPQKRDTASGERDMGGQSSRCDSQKGARRTGKMSR